ncbi:hypothetical protein DL768_001260 [Monosporascus sp. mg162]|nr:hypothetical protein DL768_001260 [Monosporascus sp. mg162]
MPPPKGGYAPSLDKFLDSLKRRPVEASVESLVSLLKRRQIKGSEACAIATAHILLQVVAKDKWTSVDHLISRIRSVGSELVKAQPRELVVGNVVRRVLGLIRDEALEDRNDPGSDSISDLREASPSPAHAPTESSPAGKPIRPPGLNLLGSFARTQSMYHLLSDPDYAPPGSPQFGSGTSTPLAHAQNANVYAFRTEIIEGIEEIMDEIKQVDEQVQAYSDIVIHPGDYILVHQPTRTVQKFLAKAASKRRFTVFLAIDPSQALPDEDVYGSFRKSVTSHGSVVVTIMNAGMMAYMSRVNKVILSARAITGKGEVVVDSGAAVIARAARELGRTVIVLGGVYKVSPDSHELETLVEWGDPSKYVSFSDGPIVGHVSVRNAVSEFIPAEFVDTYLTNLGAHSRDHLTGIITDHYKEEDINFNLAGKIER